MKTNDLIAARLSTLINEIRNYENNLEIYKGTVDYLNKRIEICRNEAQSLEDLLNNLKKFSNKPWLN